MMIFLPDSIQDGDPVDRPTVPCHAGPEIVTGASPVMPRRVGEVIRQ
ncbi:hypothetical protein [Microlunatus sp. Gsoil 973]|nr:hypothetical protein [Microlunatus sp. Gsoil 973]QGN32434.1 hypothetical protein GJV80_06050 [Microlunatus sp. Gsoil 973]